MCPRKAMRTVQAAFAWIEQVSPGGALYLCQWNRKWQAFNLIGGHQEPGESAWQCVVREIAEELGLAAGDDIAVAGEPLARIEFTAWSVPLGEWTAYDMTAFAATIASPAALARVGESAENRWLSAAELTAGRTADGRAVSEVATRFAAVIGLPAT